MKTAYFLYGLMLGLAPLFLGILAAMIAPHSDMAYWPWFAMVTAPAGALLGFLAAILL
jgi:hypothetical protein